MLSLTAPNWRLWALASGPRFELESKNPSGLSLLTRDGDKPSFISLCVIFFKMESIYSMWHFLKKEIVLYACSLIVTQIFQVNDALALVKLSKETKGNNNALFEVMIFFLTILYVLALLSI